MSQACPESASESPQSAPLESRCLLCPPPRDGRSWRHADPGYRTCSACLDKMRDRLTEIRRRWAVLDPRPGAAGNYGSRGAPGFGSRSPAVDHVVAMRDERSNRLARVWLGGDGRVHRESERPPLSVLAELYSLAWHVADARRMTLDARDVDPLIRWLDGQLDWVTRQLGVQAADRVLRELVAQLRPLTGEPGAKRVGSCPNVLDEGEHTRECAAPLYAPLRGDEIRCGACRHRWPREEWQKLGRILQVIT